METQQNPWIAAAILIFQVVVELPYIGHFVATPYLGKVTEVFPLTPCGLEMAFERSVWGVLLPPYLPYEG